MVEKEEKKNIEEKIEEEKNDEEVMLIKPPQSVQSLLQEANLFVGKGEFKIYKKVEAENATEKIKQIHKYKNQIKVAEEDYLKNINDSLQSLELEKNARKKPIGLVLQRLDDYEGTLKIGLSTYYLAKEKHDREIQEIAKKKMTEELEKRKQEYEQKKKDDNERLEKIEKELKDEEEKGNLEKISELKIEQDLIKDHIEEIKAEQDIAASVMSDPIVVITEKISGSTIKDDYDIEDPENYKNVPKEYIICRLDRNKIKTDIKNKKVDIQTLEDAGVKITHRKSVAIRGKSK